MSSMPTPPPSVMKAQIEPLNCYFQGKDFLGDQYWNFWGISLVGMLIAGFVPLLLLGPIYCGLIMCLLLRAKGHTFDFNKLFDGFKFFGDSLIAALMWFLVSLAFAAIYLVSLLGGAIMLSFGDPILGMIGASLIATGYVVMIVGSSMMTFGILFSSGLIVEYQMKGMDAFKLAFSGVMTNFWGLLLASLVGSLIYLLGFMLCILPGLLAIPMIIAGHFMCYRKIFYGRSDPVPPVKQGPQVVYGQYK